jgi:hypothetical protein
MVSLTAGFAADALINSQLVGHAWNILYAQLLVSTNFANPWYVTTDRIADRCQLRPVLPYVLLHMSLLMLII